MNILNRLTSLCLAVFVLALSNTSTATTLKDLKPHTPSGTPWNEQWFYYFNDPLSGNYKITFQTFLYDDEDKQDQLRGYLHLMYAPISGATESEMHSFEYFYDAVNVSEKADTRSGFRFEIPDVASIDEQNIEINTADFSFNAQVSDQHQHYWRLNKGASPYSLLTALPFVANRWFVYSLATPAQFAYTRHASTEHSGSHASGYATTYIDKGWSTSQATNYAFVMASDEQGQLMLAGGSDEGLPIEMWAGRYLSEFSDVTFLPSINGLTVERTMNPCAGNMEITYKGLGRKLVVRAQANMADFEDSTVPSIQVFSADHPSAKTMNAQIDVEVWRWGQLQETRHFNQGALEFGGGMHCNAQN